MVATAGPYAWDPHLVAWAVLVVAGGSVVLGHRRLERSSAHPIPWTRRQMTAFSGAWLTAALAVTWPLGTVAAHWSLTALVVQRLLLVLVVAPLLLLGLPYDLIQWLTRPRVVDAVLLRLHRPPVAIPVVTVLVVGSMTPALVRAQASSPWARGLLDLAMVVAGLVLWMPGDRADSRASPGSSRWSVRLPGGPGGGAGLPLLHLHLLEPPALPGRSPGPTPRWACDPSTTSRSPDSSPSCPCSWSC